MDQKLAYVVSYNVGDPKKSLMFSNGTSIRSGGSAVMADLPCARAVLEKITGVAVSQVPLDYAKNITPDHPKKAFYEKVKQVSKKR